MYPFCCFETVLLMYVSASSPNRSTLVKTRRGEMGRGKRREGREERDEWKKEGGGERGENGEE